MAIPQEITVAIRLNNSLTIVNRHKQDDLPDHVKGVSEFHKIGGVTTRYYLLKQLSTQNIPEPVKFINNCWFGLVYLTGQKAYATWENLQIFPDNQLGLRYWKPTDPQFPTEIR